MPIEIFDNGEIKKVSAKKKSSEILKLLKYVCTDIIDGNNYENLINFFISKLSSILKSYSVCVSIKVYHQNNKQVLSTVGTWYDYDILDKPIKIKGSSVLSHLFGTSSLTNKYIVSNRIKKDTRYSPITSSSFKFNPQDDDSFFSAPLYKRNKTPIGQVSFFKRGDFDLDDILQIIPTIDLLGRLVSTWKRTDLSSSQEIHSPDKIEKPTESYKDPKNLFLASVSHELRTPLNGIVGMVTMLMDAGPLTDKQKEYLDILIQCSHQLMNLMNNILDFNKLSFGKLSLLRNPLDVEKSIQDSINMVENKIIHKGLHIHVEKDKIINKLPAILGDQQRLTQIISNLLSNAVKFTEKGYIKIKIGAKSQSSNNYNKRWRINFEVVDTGIGITKEEQKRLFRAFQQAGERDKSNMGTGLGLSIVKELVKLMHGKVRVESEGVVGKGSIFKFYIIVEEELDISQIEEQHKKLLEGAKVLIVDDRQEYRLQISNILFKWKCQAVALSSGEEAIQYLSYNQPDVVIVDICMPYMSGIEFAQEIRKTHPSLPLIALSSMELKRGREIFDFYMNKPIDQNSLFPAMLKCLAKEKVPEIEYHQSETRKKKYRKDLRILVVEDETNNGFVITEMLKHLGFSHKIKYVDNGKKCVDEVKSETYDVVLMDIIMPVMDGIEATKHLRQMSNRPYIIITSAVVQNSEKERCQQLGVDGYLTKPILKENLYTVLKPLILDP